MGWIKNHKFIAFGAIVSIVLFVMLAIFSGPSEGSSGNTQVSNKKELKVEGETLIDEGVYSLRLKNVSAQDWSMCEVEINETYKNKLAIFASGGENTIAVANFTKEDGVRFNPATHKIESVYVTCTKPEFGFWSGKF